ncbi:MAG: heme A synthase [Holophagales bacterium]|nr:heme A synthase [Holophagales bacterium]
MRNASDTVKEPGTFVRVATRTVAVSVFLLLVAGALVTSTGSGLAVPDWPLSYGKLMPPMVGGILYEHGHRLIAATVATMVGLQILVLGFGRTDRTTFRLGLGAFGAILAQAVLGGMTVLFLLPPAISSAHAGLAQIVFALTATIALRTSLLWGRFTAEASRAAADPAGLEKALRLALWAAGASYIQILLGAIVRHTGAGLAIPDWPLSFGKLVPTGPDWAAAGVLAHFVHRTFAWVVVALVVAAAISLRRMRRASSCFGPVSTIWLVLAAAQVTLGATSVWTAKAVAITSAHLAVGGLLWITGVLAAVLLARRKALTTAPATAGAPAGAPAPAPA